MLYNYSFIIPHKNCPELLKRCVDSIPVREDVQIIVVDDNSDEGKKPYFERKEVEVILLDAEHSKGAGRARNVGLEHARGKWLLFADADDFYSSHLPVLLNKYADDETTDIVYLNACKFDENRVVTPHKTEKLINDYMQCKKGAEMRLRYDLWTPWSRMVKKTIVDQNVIRFDEIPAGNDVMFGLKSSRFSKSIKVEKEIVYNYYKPCMGSCTDKARMKMIDSRLALRGNVINLYREVGYNHNINLFGIIFSYLRKSDSSVVDAMRKYRKYLCDYNVSMFSDLKRFLFN